MAINIFGTKEKAAAKKKAEPKAVAEVKAKEPAKEKKVSVTKKSISWKVLKSPHVTEKAAFLSKDNFYAFEVMTDANKTEIKKAVESEYNVNVIDIKIINIHRKRVQRGRIEGFRNGYKKALVRLRDGQKIDVITQ
jgi:large subunit ribosomal protein L23